MQLSAPQLLRYKLSRSLGPGLIWALGFSGISQLRWVLFHAHGIVDTLIQFRAQEGSLLIKAIAPARITACVTCSGGFIAMSRCNCPCT